VRAAFARGLVLLATVGLVCSCGGELPLGVESGQIGPLVEDRGDQLHPSLDGTWLVWFDLSGDDNGRCFIPSYSNDGEYDQTCDGVIKSMDLISGKVRIISGFLGAETRPVVSNGLVAWRCNKDSARGLCVTPADRRRVTFLEGVSWDYYYSTDARPWIDGNQAVWVVYDYYPRQYVYRLKRADLKSGEIQDVQRLDFYPSEMAFFDGKLAWTENQWQDGAYHYKLLLMDVDTGARTVVADGEQASYGLAGQGRVLAFKQGQPVYTEEPDAGEGVHVYYRDPDGRVFRADGDDARVSSEAPVSLDEDLLVWIDHREGDYSVAAYDMRSGDEALVSPRDAVVSAYMPPAVGSGYIVWPDCRDGDFDLYAYSR